MIITRQVYAADSEDATVFHANTVERPSMACHVMLSQLLAQSESESKPKAANLFVGAAGSAGFVSTTGLAGALVAGCCFCFC